MISKVVQNMLRFVMEMLVMFIVIIVRIVVGVAVEFVLGVGLEGVHVVRVSSLVRVVFSAIGVSVLVSITSLFLNMSVLNAMAVVVVVGLFVSGVRVVETPLVAHVGRVALLGVVGFGHNEVAVVRVVVLALVVSVQGAVVSVHALVSSNRVVFFTNSVFLVLNDGFVG
jgi:hypothetical protein